MSYRTETDSLGPVKIPKEKLWGAQTQRSLQNFKIGQDLMPLELIKALALIKSACAVANTQKKLLSQHKARWIIKASQEIQEGLWDEHFPLSVWQTGSGTGSNMNVNEVIANRAIELSKKGKRGDKSIHPNDDVNRSQSSNDTVPSAMRIALYLLATKKLLPALTQFEKALKAKVKEFQSIIKTGRTHLMDAVPLSLGQEFSAFQKQIQSNSVRIRESLKDLLFLPIGGTAVGTGLNSFPGFSEKVCEQIRKKTKAPFRPAKNKFAEISNHDCIVQLSSSLKTLAVSLLKISNDIRLMASGPRCGLGELILPTNEPGSSIMPGKVNPTQCEALSMLSCQVIGQDLSLSLGGFQGHLQLNAFKPLIFFNAYRSVCLLSDGLNNFREKALVGLKANSKKMKADLDNSLMLVTALNPHIGYDKASEIAKHAYKNNKTLKQSAIDLGFLSGAEFDKIIQPKKMI